MQQAEQALRVLHSVQAIARWYVLFLWYDFCLFFSSLPLEATSRATRANKSCGKTLSWLALQHLDGFFDFIGLHCNFAVAEPSQRSLVRKELEQALGKLLG